MCDTGTGWYNRLLPNSRSSSVPGNARSPPGFQIREYHRARSAEVFAEELVSGCNPSMNNLFVPARALQDALFSLPTDPTNPSILITIRKKKETCRLLFTPAGPFVPSVSWCDSMFSRSPSGTLEKHRESCYEKEYTV